MAQDTRLRKLNMLNIVRVSEILIKRYQYPEALQFR